MSEELKPCPFCGGKAEKKQVGITFWAVNCSDCACGTAGYFDCNDAIYLWNRRVNDGKAD